MKFRCGVYRELESRGAHDQQNTYLDGIDHLLGLVLPALIRHAPHLILQERELILVRPIRLLNESLLASVHEPLLNARPYSTDDVREIIPITAHTILHVLLERHEARLVQVLELAEEQRRERRFQYRDEVCAFALVHALVVARRVAVVAR